MTASTYSVTTQKCISLKLNGTPCIVYATKDRIYYFHHKNNNIQMRILMNKMNKMNKTNGCKHNLAKKNKLLNEKYDTKCVELLKVQLQLQELITKFDRIRFIFTFILRVWIFVIYLTIMYHVMQNRYYIKSLIRTAFLIEDY